MSWFRKTPHVKQRSKLHPHRSSAIGHKVLQESQQKINSPPNPPNSVPKPPDK